MPLSHLCQWSVTLTPKKCTSRSSIDLPMAWPEPCWADSRPRVTYLPTPSLYQACCMLCALLSASSSQGSVARSYRHAQRHVGPRLVTNGTVSNISSCHDVMSSIPVRQAPSACRHRDSSQDLSLEVTLQLGWQAGQHGDAN